MTPEQVLQAPRRERVRLISVKRQHEQWTYQQTADWLGVSRNTIAAADRDCKRWYAETQTAHAESISANDGAQAGVVAQDIIHQTGADQTAPFSSYVFRRVNFEQYAIPRYTGHERLEGNWCCVSDLHLPFTDWNLAYSVVDVAKHQRIRNLLIVGDWVNFDAFSKYDSIVPGVPLAVELQASVYLAEYYSSWFEHIVMVMGNHEQRLMKATKAQVDHTALGRLLAASGNKIELSPYPYAEIISGGHKWRATHARNYSKIKGRVADELAQKFQCSIMLGHQHHSGAVLDRYGRYTCLDIGGLHDSELMAYVQMEDSTSPVMTKGYAVLRDGTGHLLTPYPTFTDWTQWLPQEAHRGTQAA